MKRGHGAFRAMRQIKIGTMVDVIFIVAQCPCPAPWMQQTICLNQQRLAAQKRRQTTMIAGFGIAFILYRDLIDKRRAVKQLQLFDFASDRQPLNQLREYRPMPVNGYLIGSVAKIIFIINDTSSSSSPCIQRQKYKGNILFKIFSFS